jgi:predicted nucleotidyltransferase
MVVETGAIRWHRLSAQERALLQAVVREVLSRHPWARAAYVYGSVARGDRPARDIDIGIWADPIPADRRAEIALGLELSAALSLPIDVDVRILNRADPVFLNNVLREGRLLHDVDPAARCWFEARAISRWLDFRPVWERMRREMLERWARE